MSSKNKKTNTLEKAPQKQLAPQKWHPYLEYVMKEAFKDIKTLKCFFKCNFYDNISTPIISALVH